VLYFFLRGVFFVFVWFCGGGGGGGGGVVWGGGGGLKLFKLEMC